MESVAEPGIPSLDDYTTLVERVRIPVEKYPDVNFVERIVGAGGSELMWLQETTEAFISIRGRGSGNKDKKNEDECDLHVQVKASGPRPQAYSKMAKTLDLMGRYLHPTEETEPYDVGPPPRVASPRPSCSVTELRTNVSPIELQCPDESGTSEVKSDPSVPDVETPPLHTECPPSTSGITHTENEPEGQPQEPFEIEVTNISPLGRRRPYGSIDLKGHRFHSIEAAVEYLRLIHHGLPAEAELILQDPDHFEGIISQRRTWAEDKFSPNVPMLLRMQDVYLAVLLHQLQRPNNIFRLDLQDRIEKAPNPRNIRFVSYGTEYVFSCGVTLDAKANGASAADGFNVYGRLLGQAAKVLVENQPLENPFLDELLSNKDLFKSIGQKSVLFLTDDQSELFTAVEGGDVLRESCRSWGGVGRSFNALATRLSKLTTEMCLYEAVILFCSPQFCSNIVWDGDHGLDELATLLAQLVALWGPKFAFVTPFAHPAYPMDEKHVEFLMTKLGETGVKILDLTRNTQFSSNENSTISSDTQLMSRARFNAWRMICEAFPRLLFIKFTPTPTLADTKVQPVASESATAKSVKSPKADVVGPIPATLVAPPPSICREVDVLVASPLSRFYVHGDLDLKDRKVPCCIERVVEYVRLVHHGLPADHILDKDNQSPIGTVDRSFDNRNFRARVYNDQAKDFTINMNVIYRMPDVYFAVMLHQLERKDNPFRLALEAEIAKAPDPKNMRFSAYGGKDPYPIMTLGPNLQRKQRGLPYTGYNLYGKLLSKLAKVLVDGFPIENPFMTELLSDMTLFHPPNSKGVLFVGDKYSKMYDEIEGGDIFTIDGNSFVDFADFFTSGDLNLLEYDYILIFCGPKFASEIDWKGNHGFDDFSTVLTQLTALRGSETIAFIPPFTTPRFPGVGDHKNMVSGLDGTNVKCLTWGEENTGHRYTFLGAFDGALYTTEFRRRVWQKCCEVFPELHCVYLKFSKPAKAAPKAAPVRKVLKPSTAKKSKSTASVNDALIFRKAAIQPAFGANIASPPSTSTALDGYASFSSVPRKTVRTSLLPTRHVSHGLTVSTGSNKPRSQSPTANSLLCSWVAPSTSPNRRKVPRKRTRPPKTVRVPRVYPSPARIGPRRVLVASSSESRPHPDHGVVVESKPSTSSRAVVRLRQSTSPEKMIPCGLRSLYSSKSPSRGSLDRRSGSPAQRYASARQEPRRVIPVLDLHDDQSDDVGEQLRITAQSGSTHGHAGGSLKRPLSPGTRDFFARKRTESDHKNQKHTAVRAKERSRGSDSRRSLGSGGHEHRDKRSTRSPPRKRSRLPSDRRCPNSDRPHDRRRRSHVSTERSGEGLNVQIIQNELRDIGFRRLEDAVTGRSGRRSNASTDRSDAGQDRSRSHRSRENDRRSRDSLERPRSRCSPGSSRQDREYRHGSPASGHDVSYFGNPYGSRDSPASGRHAHRRATPVENFYGDRHQFHCTTPLEDTFGNCSDDGGEQPFLELFPRRSAR